jgi:hypothetical protein
MFMYSLGYFESNDLNGLYPIHNRQDEIIKYETTSRKCHRLQTNP